MKSARTVESRDSTSTSDSERQYGSTYASALRSSFDFGDVLIQPWPRARAGRSAPRDQDPAGHVGLHVEGAEQLVRARVVAVDRAARDADVELRAVRADHQPHAGAAAEGDLGVHAAALEVERPELVVADLVVDPVRAVAPRREREAHLLAGA